MLSIQITQVGAISKECKSLLWQNELQHGLVYKRSSGKLVGFCEIGDINQEIENFQATCVDKESSVLTMQKTLQNMWMCLLSMEFIKT